MTGSEPLVSASQLQDVRFKAMEQWLAGKFPQLPVAQAAGSDAGFRRYFRYAMPEQSLVVMDAPPAQEDCRPFVKVAGLMREAGLAVPVIIDQDIEQGFLLLSDLGSSTCLELIQQADDPVAEAQPMFAAALQALLRWQLSSQPQVLPEYDEALLRRELLLFPEWYLQRHLGIEWDDGWQTLIDELFDQLVQQITAQPRVCVHRDFMFRNLMPPLSDSVGIGVLDFQDAVYGPISYDISSLLQDAFISWPDDVVAHWQQHYWQQALQQGLPVSDQFEAFQRDCGYMASQRHLKVIGIFSRICHRDGKPRYLQDVPRFFHYLADTAKRFPELAALTELLKRVDSVRQF